MEEGSSRGGGKHFVLVHGLCHGAWCWYKLAPLLEAAGHRVTAVDLAASGVHPARAHEVPSFEAYSRPLLDAVADDDDNNNRSLVLVGHSFGGLSVALAMERFPRKVAAAVFLAASMPCAGKPMGVTIEEFFRRVTPDFFMDSETLVLDTDQGPQTAVLLGPKLLAAKLYDRSSTEDVTLARMLVRPGNQFRDDPMMKDEALLTAGNYGSVKKVYVVVMADACSSEEEQRWMVGLSPDTEVREIAGADHMAMCSKPSELCHVLLRVASECA
ncbi:probable esterase PIR7A [Brachypodium distachyon]|uniref:AB hydrolase-1 domain-containing protein n=1 Tax=Brachypodium distachyon TaxID=15368 RepID=I1HUZ0_BRADI|nr:probable esterase PIR7A [Brachypodium distachyon]KQK11403.1 hypothetical protein BRADI_2g60010v3 [Brachypodium distachyon]|eukprot:XP_003567442.1 probable esterase PIR7A [Brachypodium distachyon]